jgi:3-methyladenine DNA glycosylase Mpg
MMMMMMNLYTTYLYECVINVVCNQHDMVTAILVVFISRALCMFSFNSNKMHFQSYSATVGHSPLCLILAEKMQCMFIN